MKKYFSVILAICLILGLCACTSESEDQDILTYQVKVVDEKGKPIAGAMVQLCLDVCMPGVTDEEGTAVFQAVQADYKVSFMKLPDGYDYASGETEFHFASGSTALTITLKEKQE